MNKGKLILTALLGAAGGVPCPAQPDGRRQLGLEFSLTLGGKPLALHAPGLTDAAGHVATVSRVDFLVSGLALQRGDGTWMESRDWFGLISAGQGKYRALATGLPPETYRAIRFNVGVDPVNNAADPNQWEPGHPLHPQASGLHWGWQGGYIFMALEGQWQRQDGTRSGWSWHLATDAMRTTVELPAVLDMKSVRSVRISFDPSRLVASADFSGAGASTHSRPGDAFAGKLRAATAGAFRIESLSTDRYQDTVETTQGIVQTSGTPFPLRISSRLPKAKLPADNPLTVEGVELGRRLFHDTALSAGNALTCASCHQQEAAFADAGKAVSIGVEGRPGRRNAMPLFNLAWHDDYFWDGRVRGLRNQVFHPVADPAEMDQAPERAVEKIAAKSDYGPLFQQAFGEAMVTKERMGLALEQYLLSLISQDSRFDRAARGETKLTPEEQRGLELFVTENDPARGLRGADCFHCHGGNLFTGGQFASNGLESIPRDTGREAVTGNPADRGKFRVPSLRNIAVTAPYMHDGRFASLEEVIAHYDHGVQRSDSLDPNLAKHPAAGLGLSQEDQRALAAFLRTLTDESFTRPALEQASRK